MVRLQRPRHKLIVKNEIANYTPLLSLIHFLIPRTLTHEKKQERERERVEKSAVRYICIRDIGVSHSFAVNWHFFPFASSSSASSLYFGSPKECARWFFLDIILCLMHKNLVHAHALCMCIDENSGRVLPMVCRLLIVSLLLLFIVIMRCFETKITQMKINM